MSLIEDEMDDVGETDNRYGQAVKAIDETCRRVAVTNFLEPSS